MKFGAKKSAIPALLAALLVLTSLFAVTGCGPKLPQGSSTYELESIEPNSANMTVDKVTAFYISLNADDNTYVAQFKAKGMPIFISEKGTYNISGSNITFNRNDGEVLISKGLNYSSKNNTITVACLMRGSDETYNAVFKLSTDPIES